MAHLVCHQMYRQSDERRIRKEKTLTLNSSRYFWSRYRLTQRNWMGNHSFSGNQSIFSGNNGELEPDPFFTMVCQLCGGLVSIHNVIVLYLYPQQPEQMLLITNRLFCR